MPQVSKIKIDPKKKGILISKFWNAIDSLNNKVEVEEFLRNFFTNTEIEMFAKRLEVQKRLFKNEDISYKELGFELKISTVTIARHKRILKRSSDRFKKILANMS